MTDQNAPGGADAPADADPADRVLRSIAEAVAGLDYGSVTITVHAARVVQLDITRKQRFHPVAATPASSGSTKTIVDSNLNRLDR